MPHGKKVTQIDYEAIFIKQTGHPLDKKPYITTGLERRKPKKT